MKVRQILHIDMDAFFASVEQRDQPALRGVPLLVGGIHRGVVAAASYEARVFGIHSAMPMHTALQRCPHAVVVPPRHGHYSAVSRQVFAIFARYTPLVEGLSVDEAFLDVTGSQSLFGDGAAIARSIQQEIRATLSLSASAGVAPCKFIAKIASELRKPGGLVVVRPEEVPGFLGPLPVERIFGVGKVGAERLRRAGFRTLGDLAAASPARLEARLGAWGLGVAALARGDDPRPVIPDADPKSLSAEHTFAVDVMCPNVLRRTLLAQSLKVAARLRAVPCGGYTVQVKLKDTRFRIETRRERQPRPVDDPDTLYEAACRLLERFDLTDKPVRLCGVGVTDLTLGAVQRDLFPDPVSKKRQALEAVRAAVQARFGNDALTRATLLDDPDSP
jgi:DNA polymerase-4